jgi:hypothetical protein
MLERPLYFPKRPFEAVRGSAAASNRVGPSVFLGRFLCGVVWMRGGNLHDCAETVGALRCVKLESLSWIKLTFQRACRLAAHRG